MYYILHMDLLLCMLALCHGVVYVYKVTLCHLLTPVACAHVLQKECNGSYSCGNLGNTLKLFKGGKQNDIGVWFCGI